MTAQTVYVVDDHAEVGTTLACLLREVSLSVRSYTSAEDFLREFDPEVPACLILDVRMPGMSGLELQKRLVNDGAILPVIFLSGHGDIPTVVEAMQNGALHFFEKPFRAQPLLDCIQTALAQAAKLQAQRAERQAVEDRFNQLSEREREVARSLAAGRTSKQIAAECGVSPQAIDAQRVRAFTKLQVGGVAELVRILSLLSPETGT
jgi:FixJ family two-component response regulator